MRIKAGYDISFDLAAPTPFIALLSVHPSRHRDLLTPQRIVASPDVPLYHYIDSFGNVCTRVLAPAGEFALQTMFEINDTGKPDAYHPDAIQHAVEDLPDDVLIYLLGSRYCETDRMGAMAWDLFGGVEPGWKRVQAIVDYAHERIEFGYHYARDTKTAWDAHEERQGVCRDFAHLAVTLCRCMNIPARYCTGYLGDIDIPPVKGPMDFSAWFDVYLSGQWHTFDARHNKPRVGRILMACGRDATDTALTTSFGRAPLQRFDITTFKIAD